MLTWQKKMKLVWNREIFTIFNADFGEVFTPWLCPFFLLLTIFCVAETRKQKWHLNQSLQKKNRRSVEARWKPDASGYGWMTRWNVEYKNTEKNRRKLTVFPRLHFLVDLGGFQVIFSWGIGSIYNIYLYKVFSLFCTVLLQLISSVPKGMYSLVSL